MPEETRINIGSHDLPVTITGAGDPLIWTHGLTSSRRKEDGWPTVDFAAIAETWRVVRYDARGHGTAGGPAENPSAYEWPNLAIDLLALADALKIDSFVSAGVSMGTATTLHAATRAPERIRAMVLTGPSTAWATREAQADVYRAGAEFVRGKDPAALVGRVAPPPIFSTRPPEMAIPDIPGELLPTVLHGAANSNYPSHEAVGALTMPTLILSWAGDPGHPVSTGEELHGLLPQSEFHVSTTIEDVRTWGQRIADFLASALA